MTVQSLLCRCLRVRLKLGGVCSHSLLLGTLVIWVLKTWLMLCGNSLVMWIVNLS